MTVGRERRKEGRVDVATALSHSTLAAATWARTFCLLTFSALM